MDPLVEDLGDRYAAARAAQRALNTQLMATLSRNAIEQTAKRLGLWERGAPVIEDQGAADLIFDSALYDYVTGGSNAVERFAKRRPFAAGTLEARVLEAMVAARFTLLRVDEIIPDVGVRAHDVYFQRDVLIADRALIELAAPGLLFIARLFEFDDFAMTSGVALPFHEDVGEVLVSSRTRSPLSTSISTKERSRIAAELTHMARCEAPEAAEYLLMLAGEES